jgi:hypothetical protein
LLTFAQLHAPTPENRDRHDEDERGWNMSLSGAVTNALQLLVAGPFAAQVKETVRKARWEHLIEDDAPARVVGFHAVMRKLAEARVEDLRRLLDEAKDTVKASTAESDVSSSRLEYRKGLYERIVSALDSIPPAPDDGGAK